MSTNVVPQNSTDDWRSRWLQRFQQAIHDNDPLVKGHPLHSILSDLPVGALVTSTTFDMLALVTHQPQRTKWVFAGNAATIFAALSGCVAAAVGLWDYQAIPQEHPARSVGAWHGWSNGAILALLLVSVGARQSAHHKTGRFCSLAALGMLGVSGWLGGELVFRLGWRVMPAEQNEQLEETLRQRGETTIIEQAQEKVRQYEQTHALLP